MNPDLEQSTASSLPNYYEYTLCRLVEKKIEAIIERIQHDKPANEDAGTPRVRGTNSVLSFYADSARDLEITPIDEIDEVGDGCIRKVTGGFNIYSTGGNYYLFKQSMRTAITPNEDKRLKKLINDSSLKPFDEIENEEIIALVESGLTRRTSLSKGDFALILYNELQKKDEANITFLEVFTAEVGKPTKKLLGSMTFSELLYLVEDRLKMNLFAPYFENGYEVSQGIQYRIKTGLTLDTVYNTYSEELLDKGFKEEIVVTMKKMEEIEKTLDSLDTKELNLDIFVQKADFKNELVSIFRRYGEVSSSVEPSFYEKENEKHGFYNNIKIESFTCPEIIDEKFTKMALQTSSAINVLSKSHPTLLLDLNIETERKKTVFDYGLKRGLKNLVLYAESLIDITKDATDKKKKVGEIEHKQKDSTTRGFAL